MNPFGLIRDLAIDFDPVGSWWFLGVVTLLLAAAVLRGTVRLALGLFGGCKGLLDGLSCSLQRRTPGVRFRR